MASLGTPHCANCIGTLSFPADPRRLCQRAGLVQFLFAVPNVMIHPVSLYFIIRRGVVLKDVGDA